MEDLKKPILPGNGASDYERYLHTDEPLSLQKPAEEMLHPDELTFQVTHQSSELWCVTWKVSSSGCSISSSGFWRESSSSVCR